MNRVESAGRILSGVLAIAVAAASWRFLVMGLEPAFPHMLHLLVPLDPMFVIHVVAGPLALIILPFQFSSRIRNGHRGLHRWLGRVYCTAVLFAGVAGFFIGLNAQGGAVAQIGFVVLAAIWLCCTFQAYLHIRVRRIGKHREWMIRSAVLTFAGVTLRIIFPLELAAGVPIEIAYPAVAWLCWVPNLVVAELIIRRMPATAPA